MSPTDDTDDRIDTESHTYTGIGSLQITYESCAPQPTGVTLTVPRMALADVLADGATRYLPTQDAPRVELRLADAGGDRA